MFIKLQQLLDSTRVLDFLAPLLLRLYLVPIFWIAGNAKLEHFEYTVQSFRDDYGFPIPGVMAALATSTELAGAIMLLFGFGVRWISFPLLITMIVAVFSAHWQNGWQMVADSFFCLFNCEDAADATNRLSVAKDILREHGNYDWLTGQGNFVVLNNGIEMGATYFIMLLALFFIGGGRYFSADYWIARRFMGKD